MNTPLDSVLFNALSGEERVENVVCVMKIVEKAMFPYSYMKSLVEDPRVQRRNAYISSMNKLWGRNSPIEVRQTSIRIFDTYLAYFYHSRSGLVLEDQEFLDYLEIVSCIIAIKLYDSTQYFNVDYQRFNSQKLQIFELRVVMEIGPRISMVGTTAYFIRYAIELSGEIFEKDYVENKAIQVVQLFSEDARSLLYAPSTIAIAAVNLALSLAGAAAASDNLMQRLPQNFVMSAVEENDDETALFPVVSDKNRYLDIVTCQYELLAREVKRSQEQAKLSPSPTSVSEC